MTTPATSSRPTATRSIYFYRMDGGATESGAPRRVDIRPALEYVNKLPFEQVGGRYLIQKDGDVYCAWISHVGDVSNVAFGLIRRNALPQAESSGKLKNLVLAEEEGLCEVSHLCIFPNEIVGVEYNHYGPRASRFAEYINKMGAAQAPEFQMEALMRQDIAAKLQNKVAVRTFEMKVRRAHIETIRSMHAKTGEALDSLARGSEADTIGIMLGPRPWQKDNLGQEIMAFIRNMVRRPDLREIVVQFKAALLEEGSDRPDEVNLLQDHLISSRKILRIGERSRVLDSDDAYRNIQDAYAALRQDLLSAPSVSVKRA
ncbi:hypothetical protein [Catenuloplanes indicus]|uniref:Uncharacterized protein n=1 Tax=Catenuloplanes indicus TaxID=137267 RepID=A0AAE4AZK5_9ACTN|nr:hypothetical protein [Catenuloplanes indicus]MDQ0367846.1 hypothetical protein [Catenuloplanes indicus]